MSRWLGGRVQFYKPKIKHYPTPRTTRRPRMSSSSPRVRFRFRNSSNDVLDGHGTGTVVTILFYSALIGVQRRCRARDETKNRTIVIRRPVRDPVAIILTRLGGIRIIIYRVFQKRSIYQDVSNEHRVLSVRANPPTTRSLLRRHTLCPSALTSG